MNRNDLLIAHVIGAMDIYARGLKTAVRMLQDRARKDFICRCYASWKKTLVCGLWPSRKLWSSSVIACTTTILSATAFRQTGISGKHSQRLHLIQEPLPKLLPEFPDPGRLRLNRRAQTLYVRIKLAKIGIDHVLPARRCAGQG